MPKYTDEDIRERSQALHDAEEAWDELEYLKNQKVPCRECGGSGQVGGGVFNSTCPTCLGQRVLDAPGSSGLADRPNFRELRAQIGAHGDYLALSAPASTVSAGFDYSDAKTGSGAAVFDPAGRKQATGARQTRTLTEPTHDLPTVAEIRAMEQKALDATRALGPGAPGRFDPKSLPQPEKAQGLGSEDAMGHDFSDAEFSDLEDDANKRARRG